MSEQQDRLNEALSGRYAIVRELGRGGMATVYLAHDVKHDRDVALKLLRPELAAVLGPERFLREITLTAKLDHPHILPLLDSGDAGGQLYYVMPYVEGESLRDRLNREKQLSFEDALRITTEVADALSYAHTRKLIHRDIKPENILLSAGHARVADFGIARAITTAGGEKLTGTGLIVGTPSYMSPEQGAGDSELDGRSDLYSLGCVLYEMLAGTPPFTAPTPQALLARHARDPVPPLRTIRPGTPPEVEAMIERLLATNPADRFPTSTAATVALRAAPRVAVGRAAPQVARGAWRAVAAGVVVIIAAVLVWRWREARPTLRTNLLAVASFSIPDPSLAPLRDALGDLLTSAMDGAGSLRTVSMRRVLEVADGASDVDAGVRLGRRTGASLVVVGQTLALGADSARVRATLIDVEQARPLGDVERRGPRLRLDLWVDSLSLDLLRAIGRVRPLAMVRRAGIGTGSLPALKAFLHGEQYLRRGMLDSAQVEYDLAVQLDTTFVLALKRQMETSRARCEESGYQFETLDAALRFAAKAHELDGRDSALVHLNTLRAWPSWVTGYREMELALTLLLNGTAEAVQKFPEDPEILVYRGEALRDAARSTGERSAAFDAFSRAIAADSFFAASYPGAIQTAAMTGRGKDARRLATMFATLGATGGCAEGARLIGEMLPGGLTGAARARRLQDVSGFALWVAAQAFAVWPDPNETAIELMRVALERRLPPFDTNDTLETLQSSLRDALMFRGHLHAADSLGQSDWDWQVRQSAFVGTISRDSILRTAHRRLEQAGLDDDPVVLWWIELVAGERDMARLQRFAGRLDSIGRSQRGAIREDYSGQRANQLATLDYAQHYLAAVVSLGQGDTVQALEGLAKLSDEVCYGCFMHAVLLARLRAARGDYKEAERFYRQILRYSPDATHVLWTLEHGSVLEKLGDRTGASEAYQFVADVWVNADPVLQHYVEDAKAGLRRVS